MNSGASSKLSTDATDGWRDGPCSCRGRLGAQAFSSSAMRVGRPVNLVQPIVESDVARVGEAAAGVDTMEEGALREAEVLARTRGHTPRCSGPR